MSHYARHFALVVAVLTLSTGCSGLRAPSRSPVLVAGAPIGKSSSFELSGAYTVEWAALSRAATGCHYTAFLRRLDGPEVGLSLGDHQVVGVARETGTLQSGVLPRGVYYVEAPSGCGWEVIFRPA